MKNFKQFHDVNDNGQNNHDVSSASLNNKSISVFSKFGRFHHCSSPNILPLRRKTIIPSVSARYHKEVSNRDDPKLDTVDAQIAIKINDCSLSKQYDEDDCLSCGSNQSLCSFYSVYPISRSSSAVDVLRSPVYEIFHDTID